MSIIDNDPYWSIGNDPFWSARWDYTDNLTLVDTRSILTWPDRPESNPPRLVLCNEAGDSFAGDTANLDLFFASMFLAQAHRCNFILQFGNVRRAFEYLRHGATPNRVMNRVREICYILGKAHICDTKLATILDAAVLDLKNNGLPWPLPNVCLAFAMMNIRNGRDRRVALDFFTHTPARWRALWFAPCFGEPAFGYFAQGKEYVPDERNLSKADAIEMREAHVQLLHWCYVGTAPDFANANPPRRCELPAVRSVIDQATEHGIPVYIDKLASGWEKIQSFPPAFQIRAFPPEWEREPVTPDTFRTLIADVQEIDANRRAFSLVQLPPGSAEVKVQNGTAVPLTNDEMDDVNADADEFVTYDPNEDQRNSGIGSTTATPLTATEFVAATPGELEALVNQLTPEAIRAVFRDTSQLDLVDKLERDGKGEAAEKAWQILNPKPAEPFIGSGVVENIAIPPGQVVYIGPGDARPREWPLPTEPNPPGGTSGNHPPVKVELRDGPDDKIGTVTGPIHKRGCLAGSGSPEPCVCDEIPAEDRPEDRREPQ